MESITHFVNNDLEPYIVIYEDIYIFRLDQTMFFSNFIATVIISNQQSAISNQQK